MQSASRRINRLFILLLLMTGGCASDIPPSGGPANTDPLQVIFSDPAPSSLNVSTGRIRLTFNHEITARQLLKALVVSPSIEQYDITVDENNAEIRVKKPLAHNQTYSITLSKTLRDNLGRTFAAPYAFSFSTGAIINNGSISGKVINYDFSPAPNALILAFADHQEKSGKGGLLNNIPDYLIQADRSGSFSFYHIAAGSYRIIAVNDSNNDLSYSEGSEEYGVSSTALVQTGSTNLLFRFSELSEKTQRRSSKSAPTLSETGSISGRCFASGQKIIVEASTPTASFSTTATRDKRGIFYYSFNELPPGSYTVNAYLSSNKKINETKAAWNPGSIKPFLPADPIGYYPEKVTVRPRWSAENIDIHFTAK
ncbi:MAG: hypothetical protein FDX02_01050 [Chlorobium sp.]|nr:MAG: hypothetical protein FDX02_01050 [Chlorobium sp.]